PDFAECATQAFRCDAVPAAVPDQNVFRSFGVCSWLAPLMCLSQEVRRRELLFGDPLAEHRALAVVVGAAEEAQCFGDGSGLRDCCSQFLARGPRASLGKPAAVGEVRDVDAEVLKASVKVAPEVAVRTSAEEGDDLVDVGALRSGLSQTL